MKILMLFFGIALLNCSISLASPCDEDVDKVCGHNQPGTGRVGDCLQSHKDELSYPCREWMKKMDNSLRQLQSACGVAARDYCRNVRPGYQRVKNCLMSNFDKLPPECQQALKGTGQ